MPDLITQNNNHFLPSRCKHRESRWEVHHHLCSILLSLLLQNEGTYCRRKENWKGKRFLWTFVFTSFQL